ncbi:tail fiber protein [Vibrio phage D164]
MFKKVFVFVFLMTFAASASAVPVVIGLAIAVGASALGVAAATAIAIGLAAASLTYALTMKVPTPGRTQQEIKQLLRSSRAPKSVVYGRTYLSGALLFAEEEPGENENDEGIVEEDLYMAIGISDHPLDAVEQVDLNETFIGEFGSKARYQLHNGDTTVDTVLLNGAPSWRADMIGRGTAWARLVLTFDRELYANGVPTPRFLVRGKRVWDPRDDTMSYSNNAALVILDFFLSYMNIPRSRIITSGFGSFIDAANLCDEFVTNPDGSMSRRYTINGTFNLSEKPASVLNDMLNACAGQLVRPAGRIGFLPGAFYGPSTFTLTESDVIGDVDIMPQPAYGDAANTIKGTFVDAEQDWVETDFPPVVDVNARTRDGRELTHDMKFRFTTDVYQAQRVASITLKRGLAGGSITMTTNLRGLYCQIGRVINVDLPTIGLGGTYRVISQSSHLSEGVMLELASDNVSLYDDAIGTPFVSPPLTNIPVQGVRPPSSVQFLVDQVGDIVQGIVSWRINSGQSASTDVRFRKQSDGEVVRTGNVTGNSFKVDGLVADDYIVEVRTVSTLGFVSAWASALFTISIPPIPTSVNAKRSNWSIELIPQVSGGFPSGTLFEFRHIQDSESFITGSPSFDNSNISQSDSLFTGSSFNHSGLIPDRYQHYWVRSVNSYGQSEWLYVRTGTTRVQDLVTTVLERLVAIEVQSQNWNPNSETNISDTGYKLFSNFSSSVTLPDGRVLQNPDGLAVFNDGIFRGDLFARSLTLGPGVSIPATNVTGLPEVRAGNSTFIQNNEPTSDIAAGDLWIDSNDDNKLYRYDGAAWILVRDAGIAAALASAATAITNAANAQATADGKVVTFFQNNQPATGSIGDLWIDTNDGNKLYRHNGTTWVLAQDQGISSAITAAANAQSTADSKVVTFYQDAQPTTGSLGDLWIDTDNGNNVSRYDGTTWVGLTSVGLSNLYPNQSALQLQSSNYSSGVRGWAIDVNGNAEFNNGVFRGTVLAENIVGDVVSAIRKTNGPQSIETSSRTLAATPTFGTIRIVNARPYSRTLEVSLRLEIEYERGETRSRIGGAIQAIGSFGTHTSREFITEPKESTGSRASDGPNVQTVTLTIPIPANRTGTISFRGLGRQAQSGRTARCIATISALQGNVWSAFLFRNGGDLS